MIITRDAFYAQRITPRDNRLFAAQHACVSLVLADITPLANQGIPIVLPTGPEALPLALLQPGQDNPFGDHTPRLWKHYPFSLTQHVVGLDADGCGQLGSVLWADPYAPHWGDTTGHRLFEPDGQASDYLQSTLSGLREAQQETLVTQQLVWQLHQLRVLLPDTITHSGHCWCVYRIDMDHLQTRIGASDDPMHCRLLMMAHAINDSQQSLGRSKASTWTPWTEESPTAKLG